MLDRFVCALVVLPEFDAVVELLERVDWEDVLSVKVEPLEVMLAGEVVLSVKVDPLDVMMAGDGVTDVLPEAVPELRAVLAGLVLPPDGTVPVAVEDKVERVDCV